MTPRRAPRAAGGGGGGGGLPWYLSDLDVEIVGGSGRGDAGHNRRTPPTATDGTDAVSGTPRSSSNRHNRRRDHRPYHFESNDEDPYIFVPADSSTVAKGGRSSGRSATANRRRRGQSNVPAASSITILLGVLTVFYFGYLRYTSKTELLDKKPEVATAAKMGGKLSKKSSRKKRLKGKKKKEAAREKRDEVAVTTTRRKEKTTSVAVKMEGREEQAKEDTDFVATTASAVVVKKEGETTSQIISSSEPRTPKRRPANSDQIVHATPARSGAMQLATPKTPQEYKLHVEQIASVVSSTGLDRQHSLQIANQTVIRRLETEMSEHNVNQREMRREELEERRREEDKREADRRHKESLTAIKGEKRLSDKVIDARIRCREVALQMFPGRYFLLCVSAALISMFLCLNFASVLHDVYADEGNRTLLFALRRACGCLDDEEDQQQSKGSQLTSYYYSYLRYASDLCPSTLSGYVHVFTPLSLWLGSAPCLAICAVKHGIFFAALGQVHRLLRLVHSIEFVHQAVNFVFISALLLSKLVYRSTYHHTSAELIWDLAAPLAVANIVLGLLCVAVSSSKALGDKALRRAEHVNKRRLEMILRYLTWLPPLVRIASILIAIAVGFYRGTR